ncbi:MAG: UvrD-helicase domain-containing protein [Lachnospiraceae bacterium]|nr:UvrD-helicase domain-containing protein [Lachnospiraceae bacterium]
MEDELLDELNEEQRLAVTETEGYVRVIAGAGSGKTKALSHRFAYLVNELGILPSNILCVTFTNKSANEMRQRIHNLTGDNDTGYINTFHGFCVSVLQEESYAVQYPKSFMVLDNTDINDMLKIIYEERNITLREMTYSMARDMIEIRKLFTDPDYYLDMIAMSLETLHSKYMEAVEVKDIIFYGYLYQEKKSFALDYNDLIKFTLYIFEKNRDICLKWQQRLEYIMIDEFQDIDSLQYKLMEVLAGYHKNLFIVGDPDQTIYTWRGASVKYIMEFDKAFPGTKTIMMTKNYRSTPEILACANSLIEKNDYRVKKELIPVRERSVKPLIHHADTPDREAEWIADKVSELHEEGRDYKDITVLYRAHYVTRSLEEALLRKKIPYNIYSGVQFFERLEIKDALAYMRMAAFKDDLSFRRVVNSPKRNIGQKRIQFLEKYAEEKKITLYEALLESRDESIFKGTGADEFIELIEKFGKEYENYRISDFFSAIINESGYEKALRTEGNQERLDNLAELKQGIFEYEVNCGEEASLTDYLNHIALFTNTDIDDPGDKIKLMTVHTAKGLEFPVVFLCGMNEGVFPSRKIKNKEGMEEERRLAFVAFTRAKDLLFMTEAMGRNFDGSPRYPSRFLLNINSELVNETVKPDENLIKEAKRFIRYQEQNSGDIKELFAVGQKVRHKVFGEGEIIEINTELNAYMIHFDKLATDRAVSFKAKLEKI